MARGRLGVVLVSGVVALLVGLVSVHLVPVGARGAVPFMVLALWAGMVLVARS
jgi:hypothetical protein